MTSTKTRSKKSSYQSTGLSSRSGRSCAELPGNAGSAADIRPFPFRTCAADPGRCRKGTGANRPRRFPLWAHHRTRTRFGPRRWMAGVGLGRKTTPYDRA
jgi:hypothetical protein